jgi:hypothetical protein
MRKIAAMLIGAALLVGSSLGSLPHAAAVETVTVKCTNGFTLTIGERASKGIMRALKQYNAYNQSGVSCTLEGGS